MLTLRNICSLLLVWGLCTTCFGQKPTLLIKPFLQDASPSSIVVKWETSMGEESVVEYGTNPKLGKKAKGVAYPINYSESRIHEVELTGLDRMKMYYYRVKTGKMVSEIHQFKTPPFASDKKAFRLVAMSDMQEDNSYPDKFEELINDGLLSYLKKEYGGEVPENVALMMIPGDLVSTGTVYEQWKRDFFDPGSKLFSQVPIYPVPGNHEKNSIYFFKYFTLPRNGSPAYDEHWWHKDYGNIRIIGMDSNEGYRTQDQLEWLEDVLEKTGSNDSIDFVFAQMHHPYKSEMWLVGEEEFTGKAVKILEEFSSETGKPSIHFFGHTHAYSRGQSRDHKHLWVNVATAGGNIDYWGEFAQRNYEEFTVTQDEYGFVMVDVDPNNGDPKLTVRRYSRGNENKFRNNELRDSVTVWRFDKKPATPSLLSPKMKEKIPYRNIILKASDFESELNGAEHGASQWQVAESKDFEKPLIDNWKQYEDWYAYQNLQKADDLTDEKIHVLRPATTYFWRVRYRDKNLNWSEWSETFSFTTTEEEE
ncbi:fibronectin type III domain-containing protein [Flammeovirgaceae bacterium SG7u.111]|nr:fibronectin type III domain-containing protein [Flammeovirgaceae bacterium SG7u.132]WPO35062.1 fibronectin type III domain-containing protein [Flammeovirgaceae bacterium SG7u.111]